jgi:hypothetical protein
MYPAPGEIDIFGHDDKTYVFIHGGMYGNKGGISNLFLYVIKEDGHVVPVKSSWGGTLEWQCDELNEDCSIEYILEYKENLYLAIGEYIWDLGKDDAFKSKFIPIAVSIDEEKGLQFIKAEEKALVYLGFCSFNITPPAYLSLPEDIKNLNYGELVTNLNLCKEIRGSSWIYDCLSGKSDFCQANGIVPNSPADKAGIISGDVILEINGIKLTNNTLIEQILTGYKPGDRVSLKIFRDGEEKVIIATLQEMPGDI